MKTLLKTFLFSLFMGLGIISIHGQCTHTFTGYDSWGDGWNGASAVITVNGVVAGQCDLLSGSSETIQFQASDGDLIKLGWISGAYDGEISWDVKDGGNNTIAMGVFGTVTVGSGACPAPIPCATLDYGQDFETGGALLTATSASGSSVGIDAASANASLYGVHMQGNTSSSWYSPYTTGAGAFASSPAHISTISRDICAPSKPTVKLTFDKKQTYTYNVDYSWFRVTVDGTPIADNNGDIYFNGSHNLYKTYTYDLSSFSGTDFVLGFEACNKYYTGYTSTGMGGDATYIDNIEITQSSTILPPSTPGTIAGNTEPNEGTKYLVYSVPLDNNVTNYIWTVPNTWMINAGQGTNSITVTSGSVDGNVSVIASNSAGSSNAKTLAIDVAVTEHVFPYGETFDNETNDGTSASLLGFDFDANGWRNITGDDADWRTYSGSTPSSYTGTNGIDHSTGTSSGKYLYMESSSPMYPNKTFDLISPPFDLRSTTTPILTFWFNMETDNSNSALALKYSLDNGNTWSTDINFMDNNVSSTANIIGNMGSNWRQGLVDLTFLRSERNVMFKITGTTGSTWGSDIRLDDIKLVDATATSIDVGENLTISANYNGATGFVLNGTAAQIVTSSNSTIPDLTIDNSNGVTINGDITIDALTLTDGHITMNTGDVLTTNSIAGNFSTASHIVGLLKRTTNNTSTKVFPVGDGTKYRPVSVVPQTSASSDYTVIFNNSSHNSVNFSQYPNGTPTGSNLHSIANGYYWDISKGIGAPPARIAIGWDATMNVTVANDIVVAHYNATTSQWENIMNGNVASGTASSGTATSDYTSDFSPFGFGSGGGGNALPIELLSFTGTEQNGDVLLNWQVASQINNDIFQIHKSRDGREWVLVGAVKGNGNTNAEFSYYLVDESPYIGRSYYQLTQVDYNGVSETFRPITVEIQSTIELTISPNPVEDILYLRMNETIHGTTKISIVNTIGKTIYEKTFIGDFNTLRLNVEKYRKGYYLLNIDNKAKKGTLKFIKE